MTNGGKASHCVATEGACVSLRGLTKSFGSTQVLRGIDLDIRSGEILVLLGPNGAGKSTFLNIVGGTLEPTEGQLFIDGVPVNHGNYDAGTARRCGIQRVFQELSTFPNLSVAENLALTSGDRAPVSRKARVRSAQERMHVFPGIGISANTDVADLSVAKRQIVEIVRAMTEPATRLVILDEPTSALASREADQLSELVRQKARDGIAVIYVTHKLEEAMRLADRIVVLRDGQVHFDGPGRGVTHETLLSLLGATSEPYRPTPSAGNALTRRELLAVETFSTSTLHDIDMHVGAGEIVGIAGLEGAGQRDLLQAIYAARGRRTPPIRSAGDIAYVSGDRKHEGLLPLATVAENVGISAASRLSRKGFVDFRALKEEVRARLTDLGLAHRSDSLIVELSGGNQQRALLGRALATNAPLLLLDDPTRGVDAAAKTAIYDVLNDLRKRSRGAILYSTEIGEFQQCDRVYVMARGHMVAEFPGAEATEDRVVRASFLQPGEARDAAAEETGERRAVAAGTTFLPALVSQRALPAAMLMVAMFALAFWQQPNAFSTFGLELLLQASVPLAVAVMAQMLFLLGGDIDLGLGAAIGLANVLAATYLVDAPAIGVLALLAMILGYVLLALIVERLGVSSVVATLAASFVWLGIALMVRETPGGQAPAWLASIMKVRLWPLPLACYALVAVMLLGLWISKGWRYSIRLRALGQSRRTYLSLGYSALAGRVTLYALSGCFAVLAGLLITGSTGAGNAHVAANFTLATISAVVVGGASFAGGVVSPAGAVMAVVGISLITTNLSFLGISSDYATAAGGLVLIMALGFRSLTARGSA